MHGRKTRLADYHKSPSEIARTRDLMDIVPKHFSSVLDIGARDGHFSRLLTEHFKFVTALDLTMRRIDSAGIRAVQGDVTDLQFPDNSFDVVLCTEVLEHVPALAKACSEIIRVARYAVVIGVPYRQDTRVGRTTCNHCGKANPPWGHVNTFDADNLRSLFAQCSLIGTTFAGITNQRTNPLSCWLFDLAGNPWGVYEQDEACIHCGRQMSAPVSRTFAQKLVAGMAHKLNQLQSPFNPALPNWIHMVFQKI